MRKEKRKPWKKSSTPYIIWARKVHSFKLSRSEVPKLLPFRFGAMLCTAIQLHGHAIMIFIRGFSSGNVDSGKLHDASHKGIFIKAERTLENISTRIVGVYSDTIQMTHVATTIRFEKDIVFLEFFSAYRTR